MSTVEQNTKIYVENPNKSKSRAWVLTIFEDKLQHPENVIYDLSCQQKSKNGKLFYRQILIYKIPVAVNKLKKLYPTAQIERRKYVFKLVNSIKKDKSGKRTNVVEIGNPPIELGYNTEQKQEIRTVEELKNIKNSDELYFDEYDTWLKIHNEINCKFNVNDIHKKVRVYYIFGPSGVGKTKRAYDTINGYKSKFGNAELNSVSYNNYCWNGVNDKCKIALYDDFVDDSINPIEFKHFIDYDKHLLNTQNGYMKNNYRLIVITSTQNPEDLFKDSKVDKKQWLSRITKIIDLTPKEAN